MNREDKAVRLPVEAYQSNEYLYNKNPSNANILRTEHMSCVLNSGAEEGKEEVWLILLPDQNVPTVYSRVSLCHLQHWGKARVHDAHITILAKPSTDS